jgi:hypothetical protein
MSDTTRSHDVDILATEYQVSILPRDDINRSNWSLTVAYRGRSRYAVMNGPFCLSRAGKWAYETVPSERRDEWIANHRFDRDEALRLVVEHAPNVVCNGKTAVELLEWLREQDTRVAGGGVPTRASPRLVLAEAIAESTRCGHVERHV